MVARRNITELRIWRKDARRKDNRRKDTRKDDKREIY
jgi:hypothetical protein